MTTDSLIDWNSATNRGPITESDWICPPSDLTPLEIAAQRSWLSSRDLLHHNGRRQHLERIDYPKGFVAVQIVDSCTGEVLNTPGCELRHVQDKSLLTTTGVLDNRPVPLAGNRRIQEVSNFDGATETTVKPNPLPDADPEHHAFLRRYVRLTPATKTVRINTECTAVSLENGKASLGLKDTAGIREAVLEISIPSQPETTKIKLSLDTHGHVQQVLIHGLGLLRSLNLHLGITRGATPIKLKNPDHKRQLFWAVTERLGYSGAERLDMKRTAEQANAYLDRRQLDLAQVAIFA